MSKHLHKSSPVPHNQGVMFCISSSYSSMLPIMVLQVSTFHSTDGSIFSAVNLLYFSFSLPDKNVLFYFYLPSLYTSHEPTNVISNERIFSGRPGRIPVWQRWYESSAFCQPASLFLCVLWKADETVRLAPCSPSCISSAVTCHTGVCSVEPGKPISLTLVLAVLVL